MIGGFAVVGLFTCECDKFDCEAKKYFTYSFETVSYFNTDCVASHNTL